jgi:stage IV sporulation protein FB
VALAGPAVNVLIAALLFVLLGGTPPIEAMASLQQPEHALLGRLFWVNVTLVVFNLIPAFPMDGGRVLRALLGYRLGHRRATEIAAKVGQVVAFGFGFLGLVGGAPLLVFVALFVWLGAGAEAQAVQLRDVSRGLIVADAMITRFESLPVTARIEDAVELLLRGAQTEFPVVDGGGRLRGVLTRSDLIRALSAAGPESPVLEAMQREVPTVHQRMRLDQALEAMQAASGPVGVLDGAGRLVGLLTQENLGELMMVQAARERRPPAANPWTQGRAP